MKNALKRIMNIDRKRIDELELEKHGIYVFFDESNIFNATALIIGPKGTLYENGILLFDIEFPKNYPFSPPTLKYISENNIRIHPNLYVNGKVCLSILGTWHGPSWTSVMDITNILLTIQSLLDNNPLLNEPGFENILDPNSAKNKKYSLLNNNYNTIIRYNTINSLYLNRLNNLPIKFSIYEDVIKNNFQMNRDKITKELTELSNNNKKIYNMNIYRISIEIDYKKLLEKITNY